VTSEQPKEKHQVQQAQLLCKGQQGTRFTTIAAATTTATTTAMLAVY
jgi:hypothetical protein